MSSKARLVITAVVVEKQPVAQVVRDYGVSRSWVYELLARYAPERRVATIISASRCFNTLVNPDRAARLHAEGIRELNLSSLSCSPAATAARKNGVCRPPVQHSPASTPLLARRVRRSWPVRFLGVSCPAPHGSR